MLATFGFETVAVTVADPPALRVTLEALNVAESPPAGTEVESCTVPLNPFTLAIVIVDIAVEPACTVIVGGLAVTPYPVMLVVPIKVDQQLIVQSPCESPMYSPTTQTFPVSIGSTPAPK